MPAEIELKLALDPAAGRRLVRLPRDPAIVAFKRGRARSARVVSTYYDTPDFRLAREGVALRLRRDGKRWLQTLKGPPLPGAGAGLHARDEHEWRLPGPRLDLTHLARTPWRKLIGKAQRHGGLAPQFTTDFARRTVPLAFADGTQALLAIDVGAIRAKRSVRQSVRICELEIEVETGSAARAYELALALLDDWPIAVATANKAERGFALVRGLPDGWDKPERARPVALEADASAPAALCAVAQECLYQIAANVAGLLADRDPEWVHQMRIGTRRLRSCLALIARLAPSGDIDAVAAETKWLAGILGAARDLDVFALETLPPLAAAFAHDAAAAAGLKRLRSRVATRRRASIGTVRESLRSTRFQRLLLKTGALVAAQRFGAPEGITADAPTATAKSFAAELLARRHRKLAGLMQVLADGTAEERHAVRIAAKKLRYAAEFFAPLFPGKRTRTYLKALSALQDALGQLNDAATAARLATALAGDGDHATEGTVRGWVAAQTTPLLSKLDHARLRLVGAKRFWAS